MTIETELPAVKVKALEWQHEDDGEYIAQSETGWYHIGRPASFWNLTIPSGGVPSFETLEAAKAAAQADYERRILSALVPSTPAESRCEELVKALPEKPKPVCRHVHDHVICAGRGSAFNVYRCRYCGDEEWL